MEKIKETKEFFVDTCKECEKKITGYTEREVKVNMGRHDGSLACKEQQKRNQKLEKKQ